MKKRVFLLPGLLFAQACSPTDLETFTEEDSPEVQAATRAEPGLALSVQNGRSQLGRLRDKLGLGTEHTFSARQVFTDSLGQTHVRYNQLFRGVRIWGGEAISHLGKDAQVLSVTDELKTAVEVKTEPGLSAARALEPAHRDLRPKGAYAQAPKAELVVYPIIEEQVKAEPMRGRGGELNALDMERVVKRYVLAYHVKAELENGADETEHADYLIDAQSGAILKKWSSLQTAAATGSGNSQYSGVKPINTNSVTGGFELKDVARGMNHTTYNLNHGTSGTGSAFIDTDNTWGDGQNYVEGSPTTAPNGQTAGVDAHYGAGATYDYFKNVLGRNGIDNTNRASYTRVHYSNSYDNAFWSDACFCMTYGDGNAFTTLTALDVAGHEMTHGVTSNSARLIYSGESGGLNESTSDIHGTMVEFYARGGSGSTIGNTGGNWTIGEQLRAQPLRYMIKPSQDGRSRDAWSSDLGSIDVHYSSGPGNRMFYFLSQGASNVAGQPNYSSYLPGGMTGIGNDKAARIAYRALTTYMTSTTNYAAARTAFSNAARDLYGASSAESTAVGNAFTAINVGGGGGGGGGNLLLNPGFESGSANWTATAGVVTNSASRARTGNYLAWLDGYGSAHTDSVYQQVAIPATATTANFCFYLKISSAETSTTAANDTLKVEVRNSSGAVLSTLATYSNLDKTTFASYQQRCFNLISYKGQTVRPYFLGVENATLQTSFFIDDTSLQ